MCQKAIDQRRRSADAHPVVVPQRRDEPRAIRRKHEVGKRTLPKRASVAVAPRQRLLGSRLDEHVTPALIHGDHRRVRKHNVVRARVQIAEPPRLLIGPLSQHLNDGSVVTPLRLLPVHGQLDSGVGLKHRRDCCRDCLANRGPIVDPLELSLGADMPDAAVHGANDGAIRLSRDHARKPNPREAHATRLLHPRRLRRLPGASTAW